MTAAVIEDPKDLGFVRLELSIGMSTLGVAQAGVFGLGLAVDSAPTASYKWLGHDGFPLLSDDVTSWKNVVLSRPSPSSRKPRHVSIDGRPRIIGQ